MIDVAARVTAVRERIEKASARAGRDPAGVRLIAAAKTKSADLIERAIAAGVTDIGENYVQEAAAKKASVRGSANWHMIGNLQRNKAGKAVRVFETIQTVDTAELAQSLSRQGARRGRPVNVLVEVNLAGEVTKSGVSPELLPVLVDQLRELDGIALRGLMTVPPPGSPESARSCFRSLRLLGERLALADLSMGMTDDFEVAIEEGATMIRVGRAIFGERAVR